MLVDVIIASLQVVNEVKPFITQISDYRDFSGSKAHAN